MLVGAVLYMVPQTRGRNQKKSGRVGRDKELGEGGARLPL